jgi:hypothetical protein
MSVNTFLATTGHGLAQASRSAQKALFIQIHPTGSYT